MPFAAPHPCSTPGCPMLVPRGRSRCEAHTKAAEAERRRVEGNPYNNPRWRALRAAWLAAHPLCAACEKERRLTAATVCDHVEPHKGDETRFWNGPFQSLCSSCHSRKTSTADGGFGNTVAR